MRTLRLLSVILLTATFGIAGTLWEYRCESTKCNFKGSVGIGGGFSFNSATGYCTTCKKFVSLTWPTKGSKIDIQKAKDNLHGFLEKAPDKIGTVWNPAIGINANLYPCPHCKSPFMEIDELALTSANITSPGKVFCPSCTNLTLRFERRGQYD